MGPAPAAATGMAQGKKVGGVHPSHPALGRGGDPHPPSVSPSARPPKGHLRPPASSGSSGLRVRAAAGERGGYWGGRGGVPGRELEADLGTVRDLLQLHTPVERTLGEAAGAAMDVAPGATGSPQQICDRLRALGFRASKIGRSRRTADVLRSPRHSFVIVESAEGETMVVDPNFKAHLQVARPSPEYETLLRARLQESFEKSEMPIPPWRGPEYLVNIW